MDAPKQKKILLVDDSALVRKIYGDTFEESGYIVETAANGEEGIYKMISFLPDVVLLDMFMPKMTGFEMVEKVKNEATLNTIPIIVFSDVQVDKEDLIKKGVSRVLVKSEFRPTDVRKLIDAIIS